MSTYDGVDVTKNPRTSKYWVFKPGQNKKLVLFTPIPTKTEIAQ
jgi:hypothetical protein